MLIAAVVLVSAGATACAVGLLEQQAAQFHSDYFKADAAGRVEATAGVLRWAHAWVWSGLVAIGAGVTFLVVAIRRRRPR